MFWIFHFRRRTTRLVAPNFNFKLNNFTSGLFPIFLFDLIFHVQLNKATTTILYSNGKYDTFLVSFYTILCVCVFMWKYSIRRMLVNYSFSFRFLPLLSSKCVNLWFLWCVYFSVHFDAFHVWTWKIVFTLELTLFCVVLHAFSPFSFWYAQFRQFQCGFEITFFFSFDFYFLFENVQNEWKWNNPMKIALKLDPSSFNNSVRFKENEN